MKSFTLAILISSLCLFHHAAAQTPFPVFSPKSGFADGWKSGAWGGVTVSEVQAADREATILEVDIKGDAQPFAGILLSCSPGHSLDLSDKLREHGGVEILLRPGKTPAGEVATVPQPVQIALSFLNKDGETVHGGFTTQAKIEPEPKGTTVSFDIETAVRGLDDPTQLAGISAVRIQFVGPPVAGFAVDQCSIKKK